MIFRPGLSRPRLCLPSLPSPAPTLRVDIGGGAQVMEETMSDRMPGSLVQTQASWQRLATSTSVPAVKNFRDRATAIQVWLRE
jgi:hypothetical protein